MRVLLLAVLFAAAGCDGQLNPDWCATHQSDQDCINAGLGQIDAPPSCTQVPCNPESSETICDTNRGGGICVQCIPGNGDNPADCKYCGTDDRCHECLTNDDCGLGALCLPDTLTCVGGSAGSGSGGSADTLLYAAPTAMGTGDCMSATNACTLTTALANVDTMHKVIELAAGSYSGPTIMIGKTVILIGPQPGPGHQYQDPSDPTGRAVITGGSPVLEVTGGTVGLYHVTVAGSPDDAGIKCTNATLQIYHSIIRDNAQEGLDASQCPLTIERSVFTKNASTGTTYEGMYIDNCSPISIRNNFIYGNGNTTSTKGAVHFHGNSAGEFRFNTVAYNHAAPKPPGKGQTTPVGGVLCESSMIVSKDDIVAMNDTLDFGATTICQVTNTFRDADPHLKSPTDPHATAATPKPAVVDNANSDCSKAGGYDVDFDPRPMGPACDLGADEYAP